ncbi:MAG: TM0996/MTH895 family glutaredoxin-like protein [Deltaproteobacteria bacterium]|nr:TM0996/MTH895 family glutaredoxin-like protein [Deltaproteobacteria bacterium]
MKIEVLGTGCARCNTTEEIVKQAVRDAGIEAEVVKVKDIREIAKYGVMVTPAVVVEGKLKSVGKIPELEEVLEWIKERSDHA